VEQLRGSALQDHNRGGGVRLDGEMVTAMLAA
jgi:hypothetical protein